MIIWTEKKINNIIDCDAIHTGTLKNKVVAEIHEGGWNNIVHIIDGSNGRIKASRFPKNEVSIEDLKANVEKDLGNG